MPDVGQEAGVIPPENLTGSDPKVISLHMRRAASGLFNWAAEAGRDCVTANPCVNLPKLDPEHPRTRMLTPDEIKTFWHGLDRAECARAANPISVAVRVGLHAALQRTA